MPVGIKRATSTTRPAELLIENIEAVDYSATTGKRKTIGGFFVDQRKNLICEYDKNRCKTRKVRNGILVQTQNHVYAAFKWE